MKRNAVYLIILLVSLFSCKKDNSTISSETSQLWLKVDQSVPDFTMTLKCADLKNTEHDYTITYQDKALNPSLKSVSGEPNATGSAWILVYKAFDRSDEITIQLANGKVYKTKGFEYKEKRVIELVSTSKGTVNAIDRDISIIEKTIWID